MDKKRQVLTGLGIVLCLILVLGGVKGCQIYLAIKNSANFAPPPEAVTSMVTKEEVWPTTLEAVGSLIPEKGATLSTELAGSVAKINFESGSPVKAGMILVELDTSVENANLKSALAKLMLAKQRLDRADALKTTRAMAVAAIQSVESEYKSAEADVNSIKAMIAKKSVVAPFDGKAGIRQVNVGQYVNPGDPIVPVYDLDPLYVNFTLPQTYISEIAAGQEVNLTSDSIPGRIFPAKISAIDPQIDEKNRNFSVQGTVANADEVLRPGMFVKIQVVLPKQETVIALPVSSINYAPYGDSVYVIENMKDPKGADYKGVRQQIVKLGRKRGDQISVVSGLKPGQEIVTSGLFKLRPGGAVNVNNSVAPSNNPNPNPADT